MPKKTDLPAGTHDMEVVSQTMVPAWIATMRKAAFASITPEDVEAIVKAQITRAKEGDKNAIKFVFEQLLGGAAMKGASFVQNNYNADSQERPDQPTSQCPGSQSKIETMRRRVEAGLPPFNDEDTDGDAGIHNDALSLKD